VTTLLLLLMTMMTMRRTTRHQLSLLRTTRHQLSLLLLVVQRVLRELPLRQTLRRTDRLQLVSCVRILLLQLTRWLGGGGGGGAYSMRTY
jgi:hypothetical protein